MIRRLASSLLLALPLLVACNKENKDAADAAPEAAPVVVVVADAAPEAEAPADASAAPLATPAAVATAKPAATAVDPPICATARSAKARKSPAAINLEAQCKAAGGKL